MKANILFTFVLCLSFSTLNFAKSREVAIDQLMLSYEEIKKCDTKLNESYKRLLDLVGSEEKEKLKQAQIAWLKERDLYVSDPGVIKDKYKERIDELMRLFNEKTLDLVITDQPTINMRDPIINEALHYCDLEICKLYSLFFSYCNSDKTSNDIEEIKAQLAIIISKTFSNNYDLESLHDNLKTNSLERNFLSLLTKYVFFKWTDKRDQIPLWLVFQNKDILDYLNERWALFIKSSHSVENLPAFKLMSTLMWEMAHGRWVTTSYYRYWASIYWDLIADDINFTDRLSYAPDRIKPSWLGSIEFNMMPLKAWSLEGIWNRRLFKKFEAAFIEASTELENYYKTSYHLQDYADQATLLLSSYIHSNFPLPGISSSEAFKVFGEPHESLKALKLKTKDFSKTAWSQALSIAILNDYPLSLIKWIIRSGANVNDFFMYESPLMKAVGRPDILKLLLNKGAKIDAQTPYGKTALFYAIQYGRLESVKILVKKGADLNHALKSFDEFEEVASNNGGDFFLLEHVADFTPLIYSLREENDEKMLFLLKNGAKLGDAKKDKIKAWILSNSAMSEEKIDQRLASASLLY